MNTTDEIMAMADAFATAHRFRENSAANARATLKTAIKELVKQAAWAHHTPALLTEADAVADLAGVARPGAEPVAWGWRRSDGLILDVICPDEHAASPGDYTVPLYTTPQASQPLTDEQIMALVDAHTYDDHGYDIWTDGRGLARAIEAAHGIGAAQKGKP